jgi:zinc transporter ZupT
MSSKLALSLLVLASHATLAASSGDDDHDDHGHGSAAFEWAGIFETPEDIYAWTAQKVSAKYADATMKMAILPATAATEAVLHTLESEGSHALEMPSCEVVTAGGIITPKEDKCYQLVFKEDWWQSLYTINTAGHGAVAFFTEHYPTEFEATAHYLKDDHGHDIEPVAQLPEGDAAAAAATTTTATTDTPWGPAIGASIITNLVTLVGVILMVPALAKASAQYSAQFECLTSGFAAGAISACAFFLLLFEATHLIATDHKKEVQQIWRWGTMILAGALFPAISHLIVEMVMVGRAKPAADKGDTENGSDLVAVVPTQEKARVISAVLIGDFLHNLCDGFFVGAAFKGCGTSFGWSVAMGTISHELAQELADYVVLTGKNCKLHPVFALFLNFLSGTSVLLGAIIVLSMDISNGDIGLLLAFGGGTYLYIAFVECMPKLQGPEISPLVRSIGIGLFMLGAIAIGLVLLDHEHCVPPSVDGSAPDPHAGHNH